MGKSTNTPGTATAPGQQDQIVTPATGSASSATSASSAATAPSATTPDEASSLDEAGKRAIRAERDAAKAARKAQTDAEARLHAVLVAAGLAEEDKDPAATIEESKRETASLRAEVAILRTAYQAGADPDALLDSKRFTDSLAGLDLTDRKVVTDHIKEWLTDHPRYATSRTQGGTRDAAERRTGGTPAADLQPGTDRMAHAIESQLNK